MTMMMMMMMIMTGATAVSTRDCKGCACIWRKSERHDPGQQPTAAWPASWPGKTYTLLTCTTQLAALHRRDKPKVLINKTLSTEVESLQAAYDPYALALFRKALPQNSSSGVHASCSI